VAEVLIIILHELLIEGKDPGIRKWRKG